MRIGGLLQMAAKRSSAGTASGAAHGHVGQAGRPAFAQAEVAGPLVHVDRPHRGSRVPAGEREGDRPVPAAEVEHGPVGHDELAPAQQRRSPGVEAGAGEHAPVGGQVEPDVRQAHRDGATVRAAGRPAAEVLLASDRSPSGSAARGRGAATGVVEPPSSS